MMTVQLLRKKFTVAEFQQMADSGIIKEEERVELIEGEIVEMGKIGSRHAAYVDRLNDILRDYLGKQVIIRVQNPIELSIYSQPQPDIAIVRRKNDYYETQHPKPEDIYWLIEVADTTVESDREVKVPLYGKRGITETWLVDLNNNTLEVYRQPSPQGYQSKQVLLSGGIIIPLAFSNLPISLEEILG